MAENALDVLGDARAWVESAVAPLRPLSPLAAEPGEVLLKRIDMALAAPTAKGGTAGMRAALAPFADAWRACMELGDQGAGYVQDNQDAWVSGNKSGAAHPLFKFGDLRRAAEALASPPPPAGAAGGGSGDLGALSAGAKVGPKQIARALRETDWSGVSIGDKAILRLAIEALEAPTPDLGAQGEPVAWAYEVDFYGRGDAWQPRVDLDEPTPRDWLRNIRPLYATPAAPRAGSRATHKIIEAADCIGVRGADWALTIEWPDGAETVEHVSDHIARVLGYEVPNDD